MTHEHEATQAVWDVLTGAKNLHSLDPKVDLDRKKINETPVSGVKPELQVLDIKGVKMY